MARPQKEGLDYFPLDVDFLQDIKVKKIKRAQGIQSIAVLICLLCNIYKDAGYYILWDEDMCFLVSDEVGTNEALVQETVMKAVQVGLFDKSMFETYNILTSEGIQERYKKASERRQSVNINPSYCIQKHHPSDVNVYNNPQSERINVCNNPQSKGKKRKGKKSKVKDAVEIDSCSEYIQDDSSEENKTTATAIEIKNKLSIVIESYQQNFGVLTPLVYETLAQYAEEFNSELVIEAFRKATENQKPFSYAKKILESWRKKGIMTIEQVKAEQVAFENERNRNRYRKAFEETVPPHITKKMTQETAEEKAERIKKLEQLDGIEEVGF